MGIGDELQKLDELRRQGALSSEEFDIAKRKLLAEPESLFDGRDSLAELKMHNDVAQLDREWELERNNYMVQGRYNTYLPGKASSLIGGVVVALFGAFWTAMAFGITQHAGPGFVSLFPLFGVLFIVLGVATSIHGFAKATQYQNAYRNYQERRRELTRGQTLGQ
jgi:hypothetical protein